MKVSFVDPIGGMGHSKYNLGFIGKYVEAKGIKSLDKITFQSNDKMNMLVSTHHPDLNYRNLPVVKRGLRGRFQSFINHLKPILYGKFNKEKIIFLSFDSLSLFIVSAFGFRPELIVCHNNLNRVHGNKLFEFIYTFATRNINVICLTKSGVDFSVQLGVRSVIYVPQPFNGFQYSISEARREERYGDFKKNHNIPLSSRVLFWAASGNSDSSFLKHILYDPSFIKMLEDNDFYFIYKGEDLPKLSQRMVSLSGYIEDDLWEGLMSHSQLSIIRYSPDFVYRASSICHSHLVNRKLAFISPSSLAEDYDVYFDGDIVFDSIDTFYSLMQRFFDGETPNLRVDLLIDSMKNEVQFYKELS